MQGASEPDRIRETPVMSYPPGVTQWHIDYYAGGYDEPREGDETMPTPNVLVFVTRNKLTDGSETFDVALGNIKLHAVTEDEAGDLAEGICQLIRVHTNDTADVVYE